jgi:hypothetical protein
MKTSAMRKSALVLLLGVIVSCGGGDGGGGGGNITGPKATPGDLLVNLTTPNTDDRAVLITITGPGSISAVAGSNVDYAVFSQTATGKTTVAVFGPIVNGPLVKFTVSDTGAAASYGVTVNDAVDPANSPRSSLASYSVTVSK